MSQTTFKKNESKAVQPLINLIKLNWGKEWGKMCFLQDLANQDEGDRSNATKTLSNATHKMTRL